MEENNVLASQYLPVDNGIYFIVPVEDLKISDSKTLVIRNEEFIFFKNGNTFAALNDDIMNHLDRVMQKNESIVINFSYCQPGDYEIKSSFKVTLSKIECASIMGYYSAFRENLINERKNAQSK
jgi:hypothetical protein